MRRSALVIATALLLGQAPALPAGAAPECITTPFGIECSASGGGTSVTQPSPASPPPLRYLVVTEDVRVGSCWYWSRYGPGLDSWDPANDQAIIFTRARLPECPGDPVSQGPDITAFAWEVFRSFPLQRPVISLRPWPAGITGLPTVLRVDDPVPLEHHEPLPDGTTLAVRATVRLVQIDWGDESPVVGAWREARHTYGRKTCTPDYRRDHPAGPTCHPDLEAYPITVRFIWEGSFLRDGGWRRLGDIIRSSTVHYDVDEVIGVPQA